MYLMNGGKSEVINLGTEKGISVMEIVQKTQEVIGKKINYDFAPRRAGDPAAIEAAAGKALKVLNWRAEHSSLDNIIRTTWAVYQKHASV